MDDVTKSSGDILVNTTDIGGKVEDQLYTKDLVGKFLAITDVTFEKEDTNLILLAKSLKKKYSTGWDMFTFQGQIALETILEIPIDAAKLKKHVVKGLSQIVT